MEKLRQALNVDVAVCRVQILVRPYIIHAYIKYDIDIYIYNVL